MTEQNLTGAVSPPAQGSAGRNSRPKGDSAAAILDAAKALFLQSGLDGVNLDRVAKAAGVSRQTVYNQFGSKEAVFRAVVERHWTTIKTEAAALPAAQGGPAEVLRLFATAILRFARDTDQLAFARLVVAESLRSPWLAEEFHRIGKQPLVTSFAAGLRDLTERGLLDCPDPELAAHQFMGLVQEFLVWPHIMAIGEAARRTPPAETVIDEAIRMFLARYGTNGPRN